MEALLYKKLNSNKVQCNLCAHRCIIENGKRGICNVRENMSGILETLVYGKLIASHVDPIEKKPLFHILPGSLSFSVATVGCNFKCMFCQNSDIAQMPSDRNGIIQGMDCPPEIIVQQAEKEKCKTIAYTYTEPSIYFEYAYETARLAKEKGIFNVFVTNGYMTAEALNMIAPLLDAANVDLKAFDDDFYKKYCGARLKPVLETLKRMKSYGIFVEITTLLIPGLNDSPYELEKLASFIVNELGQDTPWHISRFHPCYKLTDLPATPVQTLLMAYEIGVKAGLKYVYTGNVQGEKTESTYCKKCGKRLIKRWGYQIKENLIENSKCPYCHTLITGIKL